jgi:hypothetical protein
MSFIVDYLRSWYPMALSFSEALFPGLYTLPPQPPIHREYADASTQIDKPKFDPRAPRLHIHQFSLAVVPTSAPVSFFDVEFMPHFIHSTIRGATHVAMSHLDGGLETFHLVDHTGHPVFNDRLQEVFSVGRTIYGWNPAGDLATLRYLGYNVSAVHMDTLKPYGPGNGAPGPGLAKTVVAHGLTTFGKHAIGEVCDMHNLYLAAPPSV